MCGIAGFNWRDERLVRSVTDALAHRGPDGAGVYADAHVSLGHRRLSIIDLSEHGRQPMTNEDGSLWLTYNGEIYNFAALRNELEARGHRFRSRTDSEVILHAYEEWGLECMQRFNGMFAFALWDAAERELVLVRDRLGVKPLYYYFKDGRLVFASEIKAILEVPEVEREIEPRALYDYLGFEFVPAPGTMFRHIHKLPPGHYLKLKDGKIEVRRYWDVKFADAEQPRSWYRERLRELLQDAVRARLVSDVPLGVFLSGGLDSSTVVALMSRAGVDPIDTFALGYADPSFSELEYARAVAERYGTRHREVMIEPATPALIEKVVWHLDEPMTDLSAIPFYLLCAKAREHVTVCLSGEGGDEVLAGYDRFKAAKAHRYYALLPEWLRRGVVAPLVRALPDQAQKKGALNVLRRFVEGGLLPEELGHLRWMYFGATTLFSSAPADPFAALGEHRARCNSTHALEREIYLDLKFAMPDSVLMKVDKMSMAHGLEVRVPFLDYRFVEFAATVPPELKLRGFTTKALLREAVKDLVPAPILSRRKQGCSAPIKNWLRGELNEYMNDTLACSPLVKEAFNVRAVERLVREHQDFRANHSHVLWALVNLAVWHRLFVERPRAPSPAPRRAPDFAETLQ